MTDSFNKLTDVFIETGSESSMKNLIQEAVSDRATDQDLAYLTRQCATSGDFFVFENDQIIVDVASTGGPSSLSTLLCPLYLRFLGGVVPCLAVPGRPAGGIDVLSQIPGYEIDLPRHKAMRCLNECGYIHLLAGKTYAPRDAELFTYRQHTNYQSVASLAIVSLLSKKVAMGLNTIGLDVRIADFGNFGASAEEAKINAERFCRVAEMLGIKATCFLSNAEIPYQPFIGRGEALIALSEIFAGVSSVYLKRHDDFCFELASKVMNNVTVNQPSGSELSYYFEQNLVCQGSNLSNFYKKVEEIKKCDNIPILAIKEGFLTVDLHSIRSILIDFQKQETLKDNFSDNCGVKLEKTTGDYVLKGDLIASVRIGQSLQSSVSEIENKFLSAFPISHNPSTKNLILEIVSNE